VNTLDGFRSTHSELRQMMADLRPILNKAQLRFRPNAKAAFELLCDLGETMRRHLAAADHGLYPRLLVHEDPKVNSLAWGFISSEKPLRATFDDHYTNWLKNCDYNFCDQFLAETHEVFDLVTQRIDHEEQVLLPKLVEIGLFQDLKV
jgi:hemerythrin-like domain-containing protein